VLAGKSLVRAKNWRNSQALVTCRQLSRWQACDQSAAHQALPRKMGFFMRGQVDLQPLCDSVLMAFRVFS
jgi:hypothetical protein